MRSIQICHLLSYQRKGFFDNEVEMGFLVYSPIFGEITQTGRSNRIADYSHNYFDPPTDFSSGQYIFIGIYQPISANKTIVSPISGIIKDASFVRGTYNVPHTNKYISQHEENRLTLRIEDKSKLFTVIMCIFFGGEKWVTPAIETQGIIDNLKDSRVSIGQSLASLIKRENVQFNMNSYGEIYISSDYELNINWIIQKTQRVNTKTKLCEFSIGNMNNSSHRNVPILITVPHAQADPEIDGRSNDTVALDMATYLQNTLQKERFNNTELVIGTINREAVDLNRRRVVQSDSPEAVEFVRRLNDFLDKRSFSFVLDVHSYPNPRSFSSLQSSNSEEFDFVIIYCPNQTTYSRDFLHLFLNNLRAKGFRIGYLEGGDNYVIDHSNQKNPSVIAGLFEFWEKGGQTNKVIADILVKSVLNFIE